MPSWPIAVSPDSPFTLANIPFGIFSTPNKAERRAGAAIGDFIIDLSVLEQSSCCDNTCLRDLASLGRNFGRLLIDWLSDGNSPLFNDASRNEAVFIPMKDATMHLPFDIRGFTDFSCADVHVDNCSTLAGASTPPSHYCMPLGYNGRASSVVIEGEPIHRPRGVIRNPQDSSVSFGPSKRMDYEAEIGVFVSQPLPMRKTITADEANDYIFGFVVLNDWSARDIQLTEMAPLGPFSSKAFATSISPWVTTLDALEGPVFFHGRRLA
ncbi:hypothetical protein NW765_017677 [Fusarium oxysporum]|nr:hypothetical protein NW765_017677 [Fusarium oxysporum]